MLERKISSEKIKEQFSNVAWIYNVWSILTETKAIKKVIDLAEIKSGEDILEVAVGTGIMFEKIIKINSEGENIGIDISAKMLSKTEKRLNKYKNYTLKEASAYNLPYKDNHFDLLINNYMLDLLPEKDFKTVLDEFYRVLKPEGRIIISSMSFGEKRYNKIWYYISKFSPKLLLGCRPISLYGYIEKSNFKMIESLKISQNTFPTEIIKAKK
jgi:ubiquinone/menaquinone biosynthesis C-methylase UbiE